MDAELDAERHQEIARCLFRESNDALFLFDPQDNRVLDLNPVAQRLTGFDKDRARSLRVWDLFTGGGASGIGQLIDAYRRTGFFHSREGFSLTRKQGVSIPVNVSVSRIHTQPSPLGLIVARDITERRRVEQAYKESERRYRSLVETAAVVIWTLSAEGLITSLNPQFRAITGWMDSDWVGRALNDLVHEDDRAAVGQLVNLARKGIVAPITEVRILSKSGDWRILEFLSMVKFEDGQSLGISGIARDVTELKQAAEALRRAEVIEKARETAERADRAKSEFLANISHEIRTPMTAILGFVDILLDDERVRQLPRETIEELLIIRQNGNHLLKLINEILELSEIEAGKLKVEAKPCSPAQVAAEVITTLRVRAEAKALPLSFECVGELPAEIQTDAVRVQQILINLLGNAIKFSERGEVRLRLSATQEDTADPIMHFAVSDRGIGLSSAAVARLFEPFSRLNISETRDQDGSGLGLAISRKLAERLGGWISVESQEGQGSTFTLHIPIKRTDGAPPQSPRAEGSLVADRLPRPLTQGVAPLDYRILLAEDNPSLQRVTSLYLEKMGATVVAARNGQEAIDAVSAGLRTGQSFDVILMDMQMPVLDGYEATRQLRASGYRGKIIALTAYAMPTDRDECIELGCDDHVSKPINWQRLHSLIAGTLVEPSDRAKL